MAGELRAKDCYVGQRVFWVMWCDLGEVQEKRHGWYGYRPGMSPEIWSSFVERLPGNGSIMLRDYGKAVNVYPNEIAAVRGQYELFCACHLQRLGSREMCSLGEASRVLRELAEIEFGINVAHSMECSNGR